MAVVLITYAPDRETYDKLADDTGNEAPPGCIVHTASELADGRVRIVDVWESQQHIEDFFQNTLGPAFAKHGIEPDRPEMTETFNIERG